MKTLTSATVHYLGGSCASRRPLVRLLGLAPAALLLAGLFTVWAGPLAAPAAAAAPTGVVAAWGWDKYGQTDVPAGLSGVTAIAAGDVFSLALKSDGTVVAWGDNSLGQADVPPGLSGVTAISAGNYHSLALKSDGTVVAWGWDKYGQTDVPAGLSGVTAIDAADSFSLALKADGTVVAWGYDQWGDTDVPTGLSGVTAIAAAYQYSFALKSDGTVVGWGLDDDGQTDVPTGLSGVVAIAVGDGFSLALKDDGVLVTWGANDRGQADVPAGLSGVVAIAAGYQDSLALVSSSLATLAVSGMTTPRVADSTGSIRVTALDAASKRVYGYRGTIHFTSADAAANLPANYTFTAADNGTHVFVAKVILRTSGTQWVRATDALFSSITGVQSGIVVTPHVVTSLVTSGMTTPRIAGSTGSIRVTALDAAGKRVYSYRGTVHFTSTDPAASLPGDYTFKPADNGTHVFFANVILKTPGTWSVTATDTAMTALKGTQTGILVQPPASKLVVSGLTTPRAAGSPGSIRVTATDPAGNRVTYRGKVHFTSTDAQAELPANYTFTAADDGTHVFTGVILKTAGTWSVTATDTAASSITGVQSGIVVALGPVTALTVFTANPYVAGAKHDVTVTATDAYGNRLSSYRGTIHITSSDPAAVLPADYTFTAADSGVHKFPLGLTLEALGTQWVRATDKATPTITGVQAHIAVAATAPPTGSVVAWGYSCCGETTVPADLSGVTAIAAGCQDSLALKSDGTVVAWGSNGSGETDVPAGLSGVTAIAAGGWHSLALKSDGTVVAWGNNEWGQRDVPVGLSNVTAIAAGAYASLALKSDGTVVAWGDNRNGETDVPTSLSDVTAIAAGYDYGVALKSNGTVIAWGGNGAGETNVPAGLSGVIAIAASGYHSLALKSDGTVVAWGWDLFGQTDVPADLSGVISIAAGEYHDLALKSDGTVVAWGYDGDGQTDVPAGLSGVIGIAGGAMHTLALVR